MSAANIVMYATDWCPYCERARALLRSKGAAFEEIDIEVHPEKRAEMLERSSRRSVPQIFIAGRHVGGSDDLHALDAAGKLDALLQAAGTQASTASETVSTSGHQENQRTS